MDEQTRFLLERIDKLDEKWTTRFEEFLLFKGKLLGMAAVVGGASSVVVLIASELFKAFFKG
jgi:hypothetical protein